jgi:hypothetical protein
MEPPKKNEKQPAGDRVAMPQLLKTDLLGHKVRLDIYSVSEG